MTPEQARAALPFIQAIGDGKVVEWRPLPGASRPTPAKWHAFRWSGGDGEPRWIGDPSAEWRIKPSTVWIRAYWRSEHSVNPGPARVADISECYFPTQNNRPGPDETLSVTRRPGFLWWIDPDWREVEVPNHG